MTNQNKSAQARQRRRSSDGRFTDEDKQDSLPSDTKIQQVASLLTDDTEPDFNQLLTATDAFDDPYEARHIEFDMPDGTTVSGYALDDDRIDRNKVPAGWHAYSVMESDGDEDGETTLSIDRDGYVNHRMDFITTEDLSQRIDSGQLTEIHGDDWGFTDNDLVDDLAEKSGDDDFDLDTELEEKRHDMMDSAIRDQIFFKPDEENMTALKAAAWQTINHDEQNKGESTIGDLRIAPSINPHDLHLEDMSEEQIKEARKYGGWDPDKHKYVHFNQDGDLEGLTEKQADKLIWDNRQRILQAVRDDESANFSTVNLLHNCFNRERQVREHDYTTPGDKR